MVGDRMDGVRITWREWTGGAEPVSHRRTCIGVVEHIATGWVLIRRTHGGLVHKQLRPGAVAAFRLAATRPGTEHINDLAAWVADDDQVRADRRHRTAVARARHAADQAAQAAAEAEWNAAP
jgi:hypothetical protein